MHVAAPLEGVLEAALAEYVQDKKRFLQRYRQGQGSRVLLHRGQRCDAHAIERFMRERLGVASASAASQVRLDLVEQTGAHVVRVSEWSAHHERQWRMEAWSELRRHQGVVPPGWLRDRDLYGAAQGVWVDADRTRRIESPGVAVSVLHTGRHYADDLDEARILYRYPRTGRAGHRDMNEIDAVRNARDLHVPIFVISHARGGKLREVSLAWVIADDHESETFLMEFAEQEPAQLEEEDLPDDAPFQTLVGRARSETQVNRLERDTTFKFRALRRYRGRCAVTGVGVQEVLDGAHVVDVKYGGTDDSRNSLLLTADLHRALDAMLWTLHPETLTVVTHPKGPTLRDLLVDADRLRADARAPHRDALEWRFRRFLSQHGLAGEQLARSAG